MEVANELPFDLEKNEGDNEMMKSIKITQQNAKIWKSETQFKNHQNTLSVKINEHGTVNKQSRSRNTRTVAARREGGAEREYAAVQVLPQFVPFPAIICVWKTQGKYATMVA